MEYLFVVLIIILAGEIFGMNIKVQAIKRSLGNIGKFYVRVPHNTMIVIMRDKKLDTAVFAVSEEQKIEFEKLYKKQNFNQFYLGKEGGLYYMGPPWRGYEVYEWYKTPEDQENTMNPLHSVDLAVQVVKYSPKEPKMVKKDDKIIPAEESEYDPTNGVPCYKSADNIEIRTSLTLYYIVKDPIKFLFSVRHVNKAIKDQIFPRWRDVIGRFSFFVYKENVDNVGSIDDIKRKIKDGIANVNPNIRTESNNALRKEVLGAEKIGEERDSDKIAQKLFLDQWGLFAIDITVGELETANPEIEDALGKQIEAHLDALALIERANGEKKALELKGIGKEKYIKNIVNGFCGNDAKQEAIKAAVNWRQFEALEKMPKEGKYIYQWPQINSSNSNVPDVLKEIAKFTAGKKEGKNEKDKED